MKQTSFFKSKLTHFGGSNLKSHPKSARPLSTKKPIHLVLKSEWALGHFSMLRYSKFIDHLIHYWADKFGIRIYELVNVGNHIHLVIRIHKPHLYSHFIRTITSQIARKIGGKERGQARSQLQNTSVIKSDKPLEKKFQFWVARPFSRIISWGKDWQNIKHYMVKNRKQANQGSYLDVIGFDSILSTA